MEKITKTELKERLGYLSLSLLILIIFFGLIYLLLINITCERYEERCYQDTGVGIISEHLVDCNNKDIDLREMECVDWKWGGK